MSVARTSWLAALALTAAGLVPQAAPAMAGGYNYGYGSGGYGYDSGYQSPSYSYKPSYRTCTYRRVRVYDPYYGYTYKRVRVCD